MDRSSLVISFRLPRGSILCSTETLYTSHRSHRGRGSNTGFFERTGETIAVQLASMKFKTSVLLLTSSERSKTGFPFVELPKSSSVCESTDAIQDFDIVFRPKRLTPYRKSHSQSARRLGWKSSRTGRGRSWKAAISRDLNYLSRTIRKRQRTRSTEESMHALGMEKRQKSLEMKSGRER